MKNVCAFVPALCFAISACAEVSDSPLAPDHAVEAPSALGAASAARGGGLWRLSGGGHIRHGAWDISFGGQLTAFAGDPELPRDGKLVVQFHRVSVDAVSGGTFRATSIDAVNFVLPGDPTRCVAAAFIGLTGTFNGEPGWTLLFRSSDGGNGRSARAPDTARFSLSDPSSVLVYGSAAGEPGGDYPRESDCVGLGRKNLDNGNLKIRRS
jgi:hypothetical protein